MPTFRNLATYDDAVPGTTDKVLGETAAGLPAGYNPGYLGAVVHAEDFGANPNGTTNCSAAINSAISAASTYTVAGQQRGGVVQLLKGTYRIESTVLLRSLCELRGISPTATTLWVPGTSSIRAVQTFNEDQILYGICSLGVFGNASAHATDGGSGNTASPLVVGDDLGGVYLLNAKAEPTAIGEYRFLGGCRSWAHDLLIQEVAGNGFMCRGNSEWQVDHIDVRWTRRYGIVIDANDGSFEQMTASRTGWAGMFVDGASNRISNVKTWFTGVEMHGWNAAREVARLANVAGTDTATHGRQFAGPGASFQKAGCGLLIRGDRNRVVLYDVQDTAGHGAYVHGQFNWVEVTVDQVGQVNPGGITTRYDGGGAGAHDWVDINPGMPLCGLYVQANLRGTVKAYVHDRNYTVDSGTGAVTPGGAVLHDVLAHLVKSDETKMALDVYGQQEICTLHGTTPVVVAGGAPYRLNGGAIT
jgi:hypothetical protein